ncbi:hypothetical protein BsWGS_03746 [Bradybaena similaris]
MGLCNKNKMANEVGDNLLEKKNEQPAPTKEEIEEENEGVPTDTGFSWVIVFSVFTIMTILIGFNRGMSVLFVDISEEFQEKATTVSLMFTLHSLFGSVSSIFVSNILMNKITVRTLCLAGSIGNAIVSVCLSVAPNIIVFLLLFVFKGLFFGTLLVGPMSLIGFYFKKRRSFASSIATAGMCVAFIVFPPITESLRVQFGMRGSFLVIGAIELHILACALLLRPIESYKAVYKSRQRRKQLKEEQVRQLSPIYKGPGSNPSTINDLSHSQTDQNSDDKTKEDEKLLNEDNDIYRGRSLSDASYSKIQHEDDTSSIEISYTPGSSPVQFTSLKDVESSLSRSREIVELKRQARKRSIEFQRQTSHLSAISMAELPYIAPEPIEEEQAENGLSTKPKRSAFSRMLNALIDLSLFKIWRFRMNALFIVLSVNTNYTIIYMPVICSATGISKSDAAILMTLSGVMDLGTRIVTGFIGDFKFVSKPKLVTFSLLIVGSVCHSIRFFTTYTLFVVYAILIGVFGGIRQNFFNIMLIEYVGVDRMATAYGLSSTMATLTLSVNHPIVAALFDATKGFVIPLHYVGTMVYLSAVVLALEPIFKKLDAKNLPNINGSEKTTQHASKLER